MFTPHDLRNSTQAVAWNRRQFLRTVAGVGATAAAIGMSSYNTCAAPLKKRKTVVVTFGGGARDEETFAPDGQENIPNLLYKLAPQSTFYSQVVNHGILGHYVATASLATGVYETFNNFATIPPHHPTVFEYFRKGLARPAKDAWVVAPSNGFNRIGESDSRGYGAGLGAGVILPKHLLKAALPEAVGSGYEHLLQDNYEDPFYVPALAGNEVQLRQLEDILRLSMSDFTKNALSLKSPDELSVYVAKELMRQLAPSLLWITLHDMDIAHSGAYSLYIEGIQRTDRLCAEIWDAIQSNPEYANNTTLFMLPDFGRDPDDDAGGNGFQHHRTGDALSRTTWIMVLGPGIREGEIVERPVDSLDLVPTLGALHGFATPQSQGHPLQEIT
jgi:hypothetical protein